MIDIDPWEITLGGGLTNRFTENREKQKQVKG